MKKRNLFWGGFFILAALVVIAYQFGFLADAGLRNIVFAIPLAAVLIYSLIHRMFFGVFFPLGIIIFLFKAQIGLPELQFWPIAIAAVLLSLGCHALFGWNSGQGQHGVFVGISGDDFPEETLDGNEAVCSANFGAATKYLYSQSLEKVFIRASFAGIKVYFDQAQLSPEGAVVQFECSFSGVELYIPHEWRVQNQIQASLGGVDEKHKRPGVVQDGPVLTLTGSVSIGGVEIIYV